MDISIVVCIVGAVVLFFGAKYAVTFRMTIPKPRGQDLEVTHQVTGIEANSAKEATTKAFKTLTPEQQRNVTKVFLKRDDSEGK